MNNQTEQPSVNNFNDYSKACTLTRIYPGQKEFLGIIYTALKLNGEAGEIAEKVGKIMRDKDSRVNFDDKYAIAKELGDVLWYIDSLATELGFTLTEIAQMNVDKLQSRALRDRLKGEGDNR